MSSIISAIEFLGIPTTIAIVVIGLLLVLQVIGELLEFKGKVVPEFMKARKYFNRKRQEREQAAKTLEESSKTLAEVKQLLSDVNSHYSKDNITKRNEWMGWVNHQAEFYDSSIAELEKKMDKNNDITLSLLIEHKRNIILDFAGHVVDEKYPATREQFNRVFKVYNEYEDIIKEHGLTNGEVDVAYRIITDAYEDRLREHSFIEDIRGY